MEGLIAGQKDSVHGQIVKTVAVQTEDISVFIDSNNEIFYSIFKDSFKYPKNFNQLHSKIRRLEVVVLSNFNEKEQANYNYLLANNLGEALEEKKIDRVFADLINIEHDINFLVNNKQKISFSNGTNFAILIVILLIFVLHLNKNYFQLALGVNAFQILFASLFGGIGALIFNYSKSKKYSVNRVIGKSFHLIEGGLRIFYGIIYALIVVLGIKSGMILNFLNDNRSDYMLVFIAIIAGASDTFIVGILNSVEKRSIESESKVGEIEQTKSEEADSAENMDKGNKATQSKG